MLRIDELICNLISILELLNLVKLTNYLFHKVTSQSLNSLCDDAHNLK